MFNSPIARTFAVAILTLVTSATLVGTAVGPAQSDAGARVVAVARTYA